MIEIQTLAGTTVNVAEPKRSDFDNNLNGALQYTLAHFIYKVLDIMGVGLGRFVGSFLVEFLDIIKPELVRYVSPFFDELLENPELPTGLREMLESITKDEGQSASTLLMGLGSSAGSAAIGSVVNSLMSPATYWLNQKLRPARLSPNEAWALRWRNLINEQTLYKHLQDAGWGPHLSERFAGILRPRLSDDTLISLMWRGEASRSDVVTELRHRGYTDDTINNAFIISRHIPPPQDLIAMAVREAFHPGLIEKYHYMDNFPPDFAAWMDKMGYDRAWAEKYWVAHWRLPSIQSGFEMLHRGEIGDAEIRDLLRTADIAPIWHEPLIQIAYAPYTRVDVRRMHKINVLGPDDLVRAYMDLGYNEERAQKMAEFTIKYNTESETEATKAEILKGYRLGVLYHRDTLLALQGLGYSEELARYYIQLEDYHRLQEDLDEQIKLIQGLFLAGDITRIEAHEQLSLLDLTARRISILLKQWNIKKKAQIQRPTKSELETFVKRGIITIPEYRDELEKRGYPAYIRAWYKQNLLVEMDLEATEAEQQAAKEIERLAQATEKTEYQIVIADLNYQIAVAQKEIVHMTYVLEQDITPERRDTLYKRLWERRERIARLKMRRARATLHYRED